MRQGSLPCVPWTVTWPTYFCSVSSSDSYHGLRNRFHDPQNGCNPWLKPGPGTSVVPSLLGHLWCHQLNSEA